MHLPYTSRKIVLNLICVADWYESFLKYPIPEKKTHHTRTRGTFPKSRVGLGYHLLLLLGPLFWQFPHPGALPYTKKLRKKHCHQKLILSVSKNWWFSWNSQVRNPQFMVGTLAQFFEFLERWLRVKTSSMRCGNHWSSQNSYTWLQRRSTGIANRLGTDRVEFGTFWFSL